MHEHSCCMMSYPVDNSKPHTADSCTLTLAQYTVYPGAALHAVFTASRMSFPIPSDACFPKGFMTALVWCIWTLLGSTDVHLEGTVNADRGRERERYM